MCTVRWAFSLVLIGAERVAEQTYRVVCKVQMLWDGDIHVSIVGRKELEDLKQCFLKRVCINRSQGEAEFHSHSLAVVKGAGGDVCMF